MASERDEMDLLAAEYVLGLSDLSARRTAEARIARDPGFAARVRAWEARLAPFDDAFEPVTPPARVRERVRTALFDEAPPPVRGGLWRSLTLWRGAALASATALIALAVVTAHPRLPGLETVWPGATERQADLVAVLSETQAAPKFLAVYRPGENAVQVTPAEPIAPIEGDYELWVVGVDEAPRSLGLLRADGDGRYPLPRDIDAARLPEASLAVSVEPSGGSPTGAPTGPVVAIGALQPL